MIPRLPAGRLLALFALLLAAPAAAQEARATSAGTRGVVEFFTSQGCADCPPAETVIRTLSEDPELVVLSYHVDYWDYIGWRDTLGSARNGERQRDYARQMRNGSLATPQAIVNGRLAVPGGDGRALRTALAQHDLGRAPDGARIELARRGEALWLRVTPGARPAGAPPPVVFLVTYAERTVTEVARGENGGHAMVDSRAVRDWRVVGTLEGTPLEITMPLAMLFDPPLAGGCAVLVQAVDEHDRPAAILAAAALRF